MAKVIVVKNKDNSLIIISPNHNKYGDDASKIPYSENKMLKSFIEQGLEWFICDNSELPKKTELESNQQLYCEDNKVLIDTEWSKMLMPEHLIKTKIIKRKKNDLESELLKEDIDPIKIIKINQEILSYQETPAYGTKLTNAHKIFWAELALVGLLRADKEKPIIKEKLEEKIKKIKKLNVT